MGFSMDFPRAFHVAGRGWRRAQLRLGGLWSGGGCVGEPILASTSVGKFRQDEGYPVGEWEKHRKSIQDGAPQIWLSWLKNHEITPMKYNYSSIYHKCLATYKATERYLGGPML